MGVTAAEGIVAQGTLSRVFLVYDGLARPSERTEFVIFRPPLYIYVYCTLTNKNDWCHTMMPGHAQQLPMVAL